MPGTFHHLDTRIMTRLYVTTRKPTMTYHPDMTLVLPVTATLYLRISMDSEMVRTQVTGRLWIVRMSASDHTMQRIDWLHAIECAAQRNIRQNDCIGHSKSFLRTSPLD